MLLKVYSTPTVAAYTGNLASLQVMFYTKGITQVMFYTKGITQVCYSRCTPLPPWLPSLATWPHCRSCSILKVLHRSCSILKVLHRSCSILKVLHRSCSILKVLHRSCSILKVLHRSCSILKVLHRSATQGVLHSHRGCLHWQPGLTAGHVLY